MEESLKIFEQIKASLPADSTKMMRVRVAENVVKAAIDISELANAGEIERIEDRMRVFMRDQVAIFRESSAPVFPPGGIVQMGESIGSQSRKPGKTKSI